MILHIRALKRVKKVQFMQEVLAFREYFGLIKQTKITVPPLTSPATRANQLCFTQKSQANTITFCVRIVYYILRQKILDFGSKVLHFKSLLHFVSAITFGGVNA